MNLFDQIQNDLVNEPNLSKVLRKAQILSYKLGNEEFKKWVEFEMNGYPNEEPLPSYRISPTQSFGDFFNGVWRYNGQSFPMSIIPKDFRHWFNINNIFQGVKQVESLSQQAKDNSGFLQISIPSELCRLLDYKVYNNLPCIRAWKILQQGVLEQVLESTRNSLLLFILELRDKYPEVNMDTFSKGEIPNEKISQVFHNHIYGGTLNIEGADNNYNKGDNMTIFDQRDQKVNTQYNAAGDINFNDVQSSADLISELQKLKNEFSKVAETESVDGEIVTDAEYQMTKAIQQSQKAEPDKNKIIEHLKNAKQIIDGVTAAGGIATGLMKAIEAVQTIFG